MTEKNQPNEIKCPNGHTGTFDHMAHFAFHIGEIEIEVNGKKLSAKLWPNQKDTYRCTQCGVVFTVSPNVKGN